jgi:hypothetical protein
MAGSNNFLNLSENQLMVLAQVPLCLYICGLRSYEKETMGLTLSKPDTTKLVGLTAEERWNNIAKLIDESFQYLATKGGLVLTASQRVYVAKLTLQSINKDDHNETNIVTLPKDVCLRPDSDLYQTIMNCIPSASTIHPSPFTDSNDDLIVRHMIESIINNQERIANDPNWYNQTMQAIRSSKMIDENCLNSSLTLSKDDDVKHRQIEYLNYGIFVELVTIIAGIHGLHMITIMKGDENNEGENVAPIKLIALEAAADATPPSYFDWNQIFLKDQTATYDKTAKATMPYIDRSDIDWKHPSLLNLIPSNDDRKLLYETGMNTMAPFLCITWSPIDYLWMQKLGDLLYVDNDDVLNPHRPLNGTKRCSEHFTRRCAEVVAVAVTSGYNCFF